MSEDTVDRLRITETAPLDAGGKVALFLVLQDARAEIERLREERRWIPVEERLPSEGVDVLAFADEGVFQARLSVCGENYHWEPLFLDFHGCGCCGFNRPSVTHWMPLRKPPKGGEVEE